MRSLKYPTIRTHPLSKLSSFTQLRRNVTAMASPSGSSNAIISKEEILKRRDRAAGAILGVLIGDALGLGAHWVYDLEVLKRDWGWITGYTEPRKGRYHEGCKAGDRSQTGQVRSCAHACACVVVRGHGRMQP